MYRGIRPPTNLGSLLNTYPYVTETTGFASYLNVEVSVRGVALVDEQDLSKGLRTRFSVYGYDDDQFFYNISEQNELRDEIHRIVSSHGGGSYRVINIIFTRGTIDIEVVINLGAGIFGIFGTVMNFIINRDKFIKEINDLINTLVLGVKNFFRKKKARRSK